MKTSIKIEELLMFILGIHLFNQLNFNWWWFLILFLTPDLGMLGYVANSKIGAFTYNIFHHKGLAIAIYIFGVFLENEILMLTGTVLFAHASFDRVFGYGLKYSSHFKHTHLGQTGKQ